MFKNSPFILALLTIDLILIICSFFGAEYIREWLPEESISQAFILENHYFLLGVLLISHLIIAPTQSVYSPLRLKSSRKMLQQEVVVAFVQLLVLTFAVFFLKVFETSRIFLVIFVGLSYFSQISLRLIYKAFSQVFRSRRYNFRRFIIITSKNNTQLLSQQLLSHPLWSIQILKVFEMNSPINQRMEVQIENFLKDEAVDDCVIDLQGNEIQSHQKLFYKMEERGITLHFRAHSLALAQSTYQLQEVADMQFLTTKSSILGPEAIVFKRVVDLSFGIVGFTFSILLYPLIAIAIKLDSPGPILFKQKRVGQSGRIFKCYKFRTMVEDAEIKKADLLDQNEIQGPMFKMDSDPRITRVGVILRKLSLDELPQFVNILRGEMSLIGTRPPTVDEVKMYENKAFRRISIKPGLTGLWQVSGRSKVNDFERVLQLDLKYIEEWSPWLDIKIILKTFFVLFMRKGAA